MHWVNIQFPAQKFRTPRPTQPASISTRTGTHSSTAYRNRPANAGNRNPRWLAHSAQDSNTYAGTWPQIKRTVPQILGGNCRFPTKD